MARKAAASGDKGGALTLKVTLLDSKPPIWRRIVIAESMTLGDLHQAIQAAMGWDNSHPHAFDVDGERYGPSGMLESTIAEERMTLKGVCAADVKRFRYTYDFGDDWEHVIDLEDKPLVEPRQSVPVCVAGKRACPPDDCGGIWGYADMLDVLADPKHPDYAETRESFPDNFDPDHFDLEECNAGLKAWFERGNRRGTG